MTILTAIKKAEQSGWEPKPGDFRWAQGVNQNRVYDKRLFLDPAFWRALGKTEQWMVYEWEAYMHRMTAALIEGKTIEQFFESV